MQEDFHYYATYCAAYLAGFSHEESETVCYCANFPDLCTKTFLNSINAPPAAATTQLSMELANVRTDVPGLQDITRIWSSFHFLPYDLYADVRGSKLYKNKYRLICGPNGALVEDTVKLAKGKSLQAAGLAMHVLADTWAHRYFAGTPSLVINNVGYDIYELIPDMDSFAERRIAFRHSLGAKDDPSCGAYSASLYQIGETSIMNLGHGRAGHLPDYSFIRYKYLPAWGNYQEVIKDNQEDYIHAFCQMIYALKYLRGELDSFERDKYDWEAIVPYEKEIREIIAKRQVIASNDWKAFGEKLSGQSITGIDPDRYKDEYIYAAKEDKDDTFLGKFIMAALAQKSMVTNRIYQSGNWLSGISVDYNESGFKGIRDFMHLVNNAERSGSK